MLLRGDLRQAPRARRPPNEHLCQARTSRPPALASASHMVPPRGKPTEASGCATTAERPSTPWAPAMSKYTHTPLHCPQAGTGVRLDLREDAVRDGNGAGAAVALPVTPASTWLSLQGWSDASSPTPLGSLASGPEPGVRRGGARTRRRGTRVGHVLLRILSTRGEPCPLWTRLPRPSAR